MSIVLGRAGYEIFMATNGQEAINGVQSTNPVDLIIMDLELPELTGALVIEKLKSIPAAKNVPVIVTTSSDRGSPLVQQAVQAGAEKILYKPTPMNVIMAEVSRYLS